eukprot:c30718_g1_i1 orf=119-307(+)
MSSLPSFLQQSSCVFDCLTSKRKLLFVFLKPLSHKPLLGPIHPILQPLYYKSLGFIHTHTHS